MANFCAHAISNITDTCVKCGVQLVMTRATPCQHPESAYAYIVGVWSCTLCGTKLRTNGSTRCNACGCSALLHAKDGRCNDCGCRAWEPVPEIIMPNKDKAPAMGYKADTGKSRWDLLPWRQFGYVADVMTFGISKYAVDSWQHVPDAKRRYYAAACRHMAAWKEGEFSDNESGLPHLAHATACLLFLLWFDDKEKKDGAG